MADSEFEKGFVARMTIERLVDGAQITAYDEILPKTFRTTEQKTVQLAELLRQQTAKKHPDLIVSFTVKKAVKHGNDLYVM